MSDAKDEKNALLTFDDDKAFLDHILSQEIPEELVEIPEWHIAVLCKSLDAATLYMLQQKVLDEKSKRYDYSKVFYELLMEGCYNPATGRKVFTESQRTKIMKHPIPVQRLAGAVLKLSSPVQPESIKKN